MSTFTRRDALQLGSATIAFPLLAALDVGNAAADDASKSEEIKSAASASMKIHYLEIVSPDAATLCKTYEQLHGVSFAAPQASLGNARTAKLAGGSLLGIRAPLRDTEAPVVRPYFLVDDIAAAVAKAAQAGAQIALPPMDLPGYGKCAIFLQGGVEHGLWQL